MGCLQFEEGDFGRVPEQKTMERETGKKHPASAPTGTKVPADYVVCVVCIECGKMRPMEDEVCGCGAPLYQNMRKKAG